jgi:phospholipase C
VIIVKENHTFDNYFGRFPGADGDPSLALAADPPLVDHPHDHRACGWYDHINPPVVEK